MGSNHSKPCCGVLERESRRAYQESVQQLFRLQQIMAELSDVPEEETHVYCHESEVDQYLEEINTKPVVFHLKVGNVLEIKDTILDDSEKPGAAEISATVLEGRVSAEPGGDATEKLESGGDVTVTSEPKGGIVLGTGALPPELDGTLASMCQQVLHALYVRETKGHAAVEDLSPSSLESQPSVVSSGTQSRSLSFGAELQSSGDVCHPHEEAFLANARKAPRGTVLERATGDMLGTVKERASGPMKLEHASSEETLVDTDETLSDSGTTEAAGECSDVKTDLETKEVAETLPSLSSDLPRAASKPLPILSKREGKVPEDNYEGENEGAQLPKGVKRRILATVDSEDETEWPVAVQIVRTRQSHWTSLHTLCKKTDVLVASNAVGLHSLPKDEAISVPNQGQKLVVQNVAAQPPTGVAAMTGAVSSPKALLETSEIGQGVPLSSSAKPVAQVSRNAQLSSKSTNISDPAMEDSAPSQRC